MNRTSFFARSKASLLFVVALALLAYFFVRNTKELHVSSGDCLAVREADVILQTASGDLSPVKTNERGRALLGLTIQESVGIKIVKDGLEGLEFAFPRQWPVEVVLMDANLRTPEERASPVAFFDVLLKPGKVDGASRSYPAILQPTDDPTAPVKSRTLVIDSCHATSGAKLLPSDPQSEFSLKMGFVPADPDKKVTDGFTDEAGQFWKLVYMSPSSVL